MVDCLFHHLYILYNSVVEQSFQPGLPTGIIWEDFKNPSAQDILTPTN